MIKLDSVDLIKHTLVLKFKQLVYHHTRMSYILKYIKSITLGF